MDDEPSGDLIELREVRERTIELLSSHYAHDTLTREELERRVELAERAVSVAALEKLVADLAMPETALVPAAQTAPALAKPTTALARPEDVEPSSTAVAFFGGTTRKGEWTMPRTLRAYTVFGGTDLDFREASLAPGRNELKLITLFGGVDIIVPPGLRVEVDGAGIFGGFDGEGQGSGPVDPNEPVLVVKGLAVFGGVDVKSRYPGESNREARRRLRDERKERRHLERQRRKELESSRRKQLRSKK